jgi:hypothetical protein
MVDIYEDITALFDNDNRKQLEFRDCDTEKRLYVVETRLKRYYILLPEPSLFKGRKMHILKKNPDGIVIVEGFNIPELMRIQSHKRMYEFTVMAGHYQCEEMSVEDVK